MRKKKCVFCDHVWGDTEYIIYHLVAEHLGEFPTVVRNYILLWYSGVEDNE